MRKILGLALTIVFSVACGSDNATPAQPDQGTNPAPDVTKSDAPKTATDALVLPDVGPLAAAFAKELEPYTELKDTAKIKIAATGALAKVELLADTLYVHAGEDVYDGEKDDQDDFKVVSTLDKAPFTEISWDTTKVADGLVRLKIKAYDTKGDVTSQELPMIVLNKGQMVAKYKLGSTSGNGSSTMTIPDPVGTMDLDQKYNWDMPEDIMQVISILSWDNPEFEMDLALGTGTCPHSGKQEDRESSKTSPFMVHFTMVTEPLNVCQWFAHVAAADLEKVKGKETKYTVKTYLIK